MLKIFSLKKCAKYVTCAKCAEYETCAKCAKYETCTICTGFIFCTFSSLFFFNFEINEYFHILFYSNFLWGGGMGVAVEVILEDLISEIVYTE